MKEQHPKGLLAKTSILGQIVSEILAQLAPLTPYKSF